MYYIGSHFGSENDGYICSSNRMRDAYRRRPIDFKRRILMRFESIEYKDLILWETIWLRKIKDHELGRKYYNANNKAWHWAAISESRRSIGQRCSERQKNDLNWAHWNKGRKHTPEAIAKIKAKRALQDPKSLSRDTRGEKNPFYGKKHTLAAKELNRRKHLKYE
jgi:hypothetical protein